jgi:protocatechuate 3,4-dioxygenase beta subunit
MLRPVLALSAIIVLVTGSFALLRPPDAKVPSPPKRPAVSEEEAGEPAIAHREAGTVDRFTNAGTVLCGRITARDTGEPVAGARIRARTWKVTRWTESGAEGSYRFNDMPAGLVFIHVRSPRWLDLNPEPVRLEPGDEVVRNFEVYPGAVLEGVVRDRATGDPIAGVAIRVVENEAKRCVTGGSGGYRFEGLAPGGVSLHAKSADYPDRVTTARIREPGEAVRHDFALVPGAIVTGFVTDSTGAPIEEANVTAGGRADDESGERGEFRLKIKDPSRGMHIRFSHRDFLPTELGPMDLAPGERHEAGRVVLLRGAWLGGVVLDSEGEAVAGAELYVDGERRPGGYGGRTRKNGEFRIGPVPPGDVRIRVAVDGLPRTSVEVSGLAEGEDREGVEIRLARLVSIRARVVDENGKPVRGVRVTALLLDTKAGLDRRGGVSGDDGRVRIPGLRPGRYRLTVLRAGIHHVETSAGEKEIVIRVPVVGRVVGRVFDLRGKPAENFRIAWRRAGANAAEGSTSLRMTGGEFVLSELSAGVVTLIASTEDAVSAPLRTDVAAGRTVRGLRLHLERGGELACTVQGPNGRAIPGVSIHVHSDVPDLPQVSAGGLTNPEGRFVAKGLMGGPTKVVAVAPGFAPVERQVDVIAGRSVNLPLTLRKEEPKRPEAR